MRNIIILIFFVSSLSLSSQSGFRRQFKILGALDNSSKAIYELSTGDFIAAGIIHDTLSGIATNRIAIIGLNSNGNLQWIKKYGHYNFSFVNNPFINRSFYFKNDYLYYATFGRDSINNLINFLFKFDLNGNIVWQKIYTDTIQEMYTQMVTKSFDGGFFITGFCYPFNQNIINNPVVLLKTDANGNELWRKKINKTFPNNADGKAIIQDSATKKIVIVGYQSIGNANSWSSFDNVLILDSLGNKVNQLSFNGLYGGSFTDLIQTKDKKFIAIGQNLDPQTIGGTNLRKSFAIKFDVDSPNAPIWRINGFDKSALDNSFTCLRELDNGDVLLSGGIDTTSLYNMASNLLLRLTIIDKNGHIKRNMYYDYKVNSPHSDNYMVIKSLEKTSDKGFVVAIQVGNTPNPNPMFFVKFDSTYCDSSADYCRSRAVGIEGYVLKDSKFKIYPNPTNGMLNIEVNTVMLESPLDVILTDALGRVVKQLSLRESAKIDLSDVKEGIYFLLLWEEGRLVASEKIVKE